ncbi:MAG: CoA transferase [Gammaproteobacteria bacterium]|nr:CoA transferase [Gammaproteobacteria bacterium]
MLGLDPVRAEKSDVAAALASWDKVRFETDPMANGAVVAACRSFDEWDAAEQSRVLAEAPLFTIERIGDAPPKALPSPDERTKPLAGICVLDLTRILAGPVCGRTLAAYGADVMLVNSPHLPNIEAIVDTSRGKLSCHVDLETPAGRDQLAGLLEEAHVFVQGYRPGAIAARGFSPEAVARQFPGSVYVSLSAYGESGPWSSRRGFDSLVQTAMGFNIAEAEAAGSDTPRPMPVQILDYASGFLMAFATEVALLRQQTEGGTWHARIGLAQTAQWLRGLGRNDDNFHLRKPALQDHLQAFPCSEGELRAMPHAARMDGTHCASVRPSVRPGYHETIWP